MKLSRLRGRKVNEYLRRKGSVWKGSTMNIRWLKGAPRSPIVNPSKAALYAGTAASTKLHKSAVKRNRMRRRCREALRKTMREYKTIPTVQILINPKLKSLDCDFEEILSDVEKFLATIGA